MIKQAVKSMIDRKKRIDSILDEGIKQMPSVPKPVMAPPKPVKKPVR